MLTWTLYCLNKNPQCLEKFVKKSMQAEIYQPRILRPTQKVFHILKLYFVKFTIVPSVVHKP
eukprot:UN19908